MCILFNQLLFSLMIIIYLFEFESKEINFNRNHDSYLVIFL